jgi:hypothetical protein
MPSELAKGPGGGTWAVLALLGALVGPGGTAGAQGPSTPGEAPPAVLAEVVGEPVVPPGTRVEYGLLDTIEQSIFGEVYGPSRWRPLGFDTFLTEGWLEPWAGAPAGRDGMTPRHGWLGAFEGVFYRLWLTPFNYQSNLSKPYSGEGYTGSFAIFLPWSRRFDLFLGIPYVVSNGTEDAARGYRTDVGDFIVTPRFLLQEDEATTQTFNLEIRTPTGQVETGGNTMSLTPRYEFWTNPGGPWVVRGAAGFFVPLNKNDTPAGAFRPGALGNLKSATETGFTGGFAVGRYFTPHDVPFGDFVLYAASNWFVPLDGGVENTFFGIGPGTRFHIADDYYFLNYWEFPVTGKAPFDYSMTAAILKVF